ncbi:MAG: DUF2116 family Zn-ribbon domain-containing protein [Bacilli bacterium]
MKKSKEKSILKEMGIEEKSSFNSEDGADFKFDKSSTEEEKEESVQVTGKYSCPKCGHPLDSRRQTCPKCGYSGYVQMTKKQIMIVRAILFVVLMIVFLVYWFVIRG